MNAKAGACHTAENGGYHNILTLFAPIRSPAHSIAGQTENHGGPLCARHIRVLFAFFDFPQFFALNEEL